MGQVELWDKLNLQAYAAVRQRIDLKCNLPLLDRSQTEGYIRAHLVYAEGQQDIFTGKAIDEIYKYSSSAFRAINKVCMHSLLSAAQRSKKLIDDYLIHLVIESKLP